MLTLPPLGTDEKIVLVVALAVLMFFVLYFEMRILRGKNKEIRKVSQIKDEAYNSILTTRSVMNVMQRRGQDVTRATALLELAKSAMQRSNYQECIDLCEKARDEITNPAKPSPQAEAVDKEDGERLERVAESILSARELPRDAEAYAGTKLPTNQDGNYLSAKFEISAAKGDVGRAQKQGQETESAQSLLTEAESAFVTGAYTKALSLAVRARRAIGSADEAIPLKTKPIPEVEEPEAEPTPEEESGPPVEECPSCGAPLEANDAFCHKCGEKILRERACTVCGTKARQDDKFCRKCGAKVA